MSIHRLGDAAATARLNSIRLAQSTGEAARQLARWEAGRRSLVVPTRIDLATLSGLTTDGPRSNDWYAMRARLVRREIARRLGLDAAQTAQLTFTMSEGNAWYLGPRPKLTKEGMLAAVGGADADKFLQLMLQREFIAQAAYDPSQYFVYGGFGPGVYLGSLSQQLGRALRLNEVVFNIRSKFGQIICDVTARRFVRRSTPALPTTLPFDAGEGYMVGTTRIHPAEFVQVDGRRDPLTGICFRVDKARNTRVFYLNIVTEFAMHVLRRAGVEAEYDTFTPTGYVDGGYIPLEPLANLKNRLVVVDAAGLGIPEAALHALRYADRYLFNVPIDATRAGHFTNLDIEAAPSQPSRLLRSRNYLYLNGQNVEGLGTVTIERRGESSTAKAELVTAKEAYNALAKGVARADAHSEAKFRYVMDDSRVSVCIQGLDRTPEELATLADSVGRTNTQLTESLRRCLVEMSIKECLLGIKAIPARGMPDDLCGASWTMLATRRMRHGKRAYKTLVSCVDISTKAGSIMVKRVRRTPWSRSDEATLEFVEEFPFLQQDGAIRDGQFWLVDHATGQRMTVWLGKFVPKIILNEVYQGIQQALALQDKHLEKLRRRGKNGRFYSKGQDFGLLPMYGSMRRSEMKKHGERVGTRIAVQDCARFIRLFVPPAQGLKGAGDSLSNMRDLMAYRKDGSLIEHELVENRMVRLYVHTLTNDVLVRGDNSKMSILEKLATLALEN